MKILLINPPNRIPTDWGIFPINVFQPLGLAYLAAVLEESNYEISILDALAEGWENEYVVGKYKFSGLDFKEIGAKVKEYSPDIVGITNPHTPQAKCALEVASTVKAISGDIVVILGGADPSVRPESYLLNPDVDFVVIGEGERTMLELVKEIESGQNSFKDVAGIAYKKDQSIVKTDPRPLIEDLDSIPFPARHLLPMQKYFEAAKSVRSSRSISTFGKRWATIITSRGCPFQCVFCSIHAIWRRKWRARSPENVVNEIEDLVQKYKIEHLDVEDDNLTLNIKRAERIFDLMIDRKIDIEWSTPNGVRADYLNENLMIKMKKSGCKRIIVAPESGDQYVVDHIIKKRLDLKKVEEAIRLSKKHGIIVESFFVMGFIGETKENMRTTIDFAKRLRKMGVSNFGFYMATPFYGTALYEQAKRMGYLRSIFNEEALNTLRGEPLIETPDFTADELRRLYKEAWKVSPLIPKERLKLAMTMMRKSPRRALGYALEQIKTAI